MVQRGIGRVDLNTRAQLALLGLVAEPDRRLTELFESNVPLELETRMLLAQALSSKDNLVRLIVRKSKGAGHVGKFWTRLKELRQGQYAVALKKQMPSGQAIKTAAARLGRGIKHIERCVTFVGDVDRGVNALRKEVPALTSGYDDHALQIACLYASAFGEKPEDRITPNLPAFARVIERFEAMLAEGAGADLWYDAKTNRAKSNLNRVRTIR